MKYVMMTFTLFMIGCTTIEQNTRVFWDFDEDRKALHHEHTYTIHKGYYRGCKFEVVNKLSDYVYSGILLCTDSDGYPTSDRAEINPWSEEITVL